MLRIALVSPSYHPVLGGVSEQMHGMAQGLARRGHEVTVLTGGRPGRPREERDGGVWVRRLGRTLFLPINGGRTALALGPDLRAEVDAVLRGRVDLLHVHAPYEWGLPLASVAAFDGPTIGTFHAAGHRGGGWRLLAGAVRARLGRLAIRVAVSRTAARWARELFGGDYRLLPNAVDASRFRPRASRSRSEVSALRALQLLVVARLEPRKGLECLLDALDMLAREELPLRLRVVGEGPLRSRLERRARGLGCPIEFLGRVEPEDLPQVYASADLALAPATYGESFGVVLLEAMAAGLPLVASDLPGYREVLNDSGAGLLVRSGDPGAWADAIRRIAIDPALRRAMGPRSRERALEFDWAVLLPRIEALYEEALDRGGSDPRPRLESVPQSVTSARAETVMSLSSPLRSVLRKSTSTMPRTFLP